MNCPECGSKVSTIDTFHNATFTRRRKECTACGHRFSTIEIQIVDGIHSKRIAGTIADRNKMLADMAETFQGLLDDLAEVSYIP
jgi:transcriptional regulator NrdR family protein